MRTFAPAALFVALAVAAGPAAAQPASSPETGTAPAVVLPDGRQAILDEAGKRLDRLAALEFRGAQSEGAVRAELAAGLAYVQAADEELARQSRRAATQREQTPATQPAAARELDDQLRALGAGRCQLALVRGLMRHRAAMAVAADSPARETLLDEAGAAFRATRVDFVGVPLASMGYLHEAQVMRSAGRPQQARAALAPLLEMEVPRGQEVAAELKRSATLENLEASALDEPEQALKQAQAWRAKELAALPAWQVRCDWVMARAHLQAAQVQIAAGESLDKAAAHFAEAARLLRSEGVVAVAPPYERLGALRRLEDLKGPAMSRDELLAWADQLAMRGEAGAAESYAKAEAMEGPPLSVERRRTLAVLRYRAGEFTLAADRCDELLKEIGDSHAMSLPLKRLRAAALLDQWSGLRATTRPSSDQAGRTLKALETLIESPVEGAVRVDALRQWVAIRCEAGGPAGCLAMLDRQTALVDQDTGGYLHYARAAGRYTAAASGGLAASQAAPAMRLVVADCREARKRAQAARLPIAAQAALLEARATAAAPLNDTQGAMKALEESAEAIHLDPAAAGQAAWLRVQWLLELGLIDEALKAMAALPRAAGEDSTQIVLRLVEALGERRARADEATRRKVVELANRAIAESVADAARYAQVSRRAAQAMLGVGAATEARGVLEKLLEHKAVRDAPQESLAVGLLLADAWESEGRTDDAASQLAKLAKEHRDSAAAAMAQGRLMLRQGQPRAAIDEVRRARELCRAGSAEWCRATLLLVESLQAAGQTGEARDVLRVAATLYPAFGGAELRTRMETLRKSLGG